MASEAKHGFYALLGVTQNASEDEIKRAYKRRALELHPDKNPDPEAKEQFQMLSEAYAVLSNKQQRRNYDEGRFGKEGFNFPRYDDEEDDENDYGGFDFDDELLREFFFASFFRGGRGGGPVHFGSGFGGMFGSERDLRRQREREERKMRRQEARFEQELKAQKLREKIQREALARNFDPPTTVSEPGKIKISWGHLASKVSFNADSELWRLGVYRVGGIAEEYVYTGLETEWTSKPNLKEGKYRVWVEVLSKGTKSIKKESFSAEANLIPLSTPQKSQKPSPQEENPSVPKKEMTREEIRLEMEKKMEEEKLRKEKEAVEAEIQKKRAEAKAIKKAKSEQKRLEKETADKALEEELEKERKLMERKRAQEEKEEQERKEREMTEAIEREKQRIALEAIEFRQREKERVLRQQAELLEKRRKEEELKLAEEKRLAEKTAEFQRNKLLKEKMEAERRQKEEEDRLRKIQEEIEEKLRKEAEEKERKLREEKEKEEERQKAELRAKFEEKSLERQLKKQQVQKEEKERRIQETKEQGQQIREELLTQKPPHTPHSSKNTFPSAKKTSVDKKFELTGDPVEDAKIEKRRLQSERDRAKTAVMKAAANPPSEEIKVPTTISSAVVAPVTVDNVSSAPRTSNSSKKTPPPKKGTKDWLPKGPTPSASSPAPISTATSGSNQTTPTVFSKQKFARKELNSKYQSTKASEADNSSATENPYPKRPLSANNQKSPTATYPKSSPLKTNNKSHAPVEESRYYPSKSPVKASSSSFAHNASPTFISPPPYSATTPTQVGSHWMPLRERPVAPPSPQFVTYNAPPMLTPGYGIPEFGYGPSHINPHVEYYQGSIPGSLPVLVPPIASVYDDSYGQYGGHYNGPFSGSDYNQQAYDTLSGHVAPYYSPNGYSADARHHATHMW